MYVEEVCIDGFKSYAQRTVVPQFDQYFNAITGLNGSGKSNILDSICFVLGITNLSQVRRRKPSSFCFAAFFCRVGGVLFYRRRTQKGAVLPNMMHWT
jgi:chromosome segregation ATPase